MTSVCDGGTAASCTSNQPWQYNDGVSLGFAAAAVGGITGLNGDENCGQCYELVWTDETFSWGGGAHESLVGKSHIIQVTNIGYDVTGDHSFDLQIPSAGQGIFDTGCAIQFPGYDSGDFDCDVNYGGCDDASGCERLPEDLQDGCAWRFDDYKYKQSTESGYPSNNPYVRFRRVRCPAELVAITGSTPNDDADFPAVDLEAYASGSEPTTSPTKSPTTAPTTATATPTTAKPTKAPSTRAPSTATPTRAPSVSPAPTAVASASSSKKSSWTRRVRNSGLALLVVVAFVAFLVGVCVATVVYRRRRASKWHTTELEHSKSWFGSPRSSSVVHGGDWKLTERPSSTMAPAPRTSPTLSSPPSFDL